MIGSRHHLPVCTIGELELLSPDEMSAGYAAGLNGAPEPGPERSRAYHHGWRVGSFDAGYLAVDLAHQHLVAQYKQSRAVLH